MFRHPVMALAVGAWLAGSLIAQAATPQPPATPPATTRSGSTLAWGQWRGARRDGISTDTGLARSWPAEGPKLLWRAGALGAGFGSVSFDARHIYTQGDVDGAARLLALDRQSGAIRWTARIGKPGGARNAGPRSTPATDGTLVVGLGQDGALVCCSCADGAVRWRRSLPKDFGGRMMSGWGFSESPLIDGDLLVCTPGGAKGTVLALDKASGDVVWRCTTLTDRAGYCSLVPATLAGVRQYLVFTGRSLAGVAPDTGKLLWRVDRPGKTAVCSDPIAAGDGLVFVSSAYRVGCNAFRIVHEKGRFTAVEEVYAGSQIESHHGGLVRIGDHVYGLGRRELKCIHLPTGKVAWKAKSVGKGSITAADGMLIVRSEGRNGVALVEATPKGYRELGRLRDVPRSGEPAWAHPVIHDGRLYLRDQDQLLCYDLRPPNDQQKR